MAKTGFGRASKAILEYLYKTGRYDIVQYCCGMQYNHPDFARTPWKSIGCLPNDPREMEQINRDPNLARNAGYGAYMLDKVISEEKPDIYLAAQDIWGVDFAIGRNWFNKIHSHIWTTLDSLPLLESAVSAAKRCPNYWVWSNFATKAMHKLGHAHVKTVHGPIEDQCFFRLPEAKRIALRKSFGIKEDEFIIGFVFRNQLRKSVPNLIEGFKLFQNENVGKPSKLLLHTHFTEGWKIPKLAEEYGVKKEDILTTYVCRKCVKYHVSEYSGDKKCPNCGEENGCTTTQPGLGVSEEHLNEVYNLMDVYCHPFTSGGQEVPIQEAKLAELITLVTKYSCGEEMCEEGAASLPLEYAEYREHQTEFIKASTSPTSICRQLNKVFKMDPSKKRDMERKARKWALDNFSVSVVGKSMDEYFQSLPAVNFDFILKEEKRDPNCVVPEIKDDCEWLTFLYHNILKMSSVDRNDDGHKYWTREIEKGVPRKSIEDYFRQIASKENSELEKVTIESFLDKEDKKRLLYVMPESIGDIFLSTSLFKGIKETYPEYKFYVATKPEFFDVLDGNPYVDKVIPYCPSMDNLVLMEGIGSAKGYFDIAYLPHIGTQRMLDYLHNGEDVIKLDLKP